jgi:hypothetical protein
VVFTTNVKEESNNSVVEKQSDKSAEDLESEKVSDL